MSDLKCAGIVGTGLMGASLAVLFIGNGIKTVLLGRSHIGCAHGESTVNSCFDAMKRAGLITQKQIEASKRLLTITESYEDMQKVQVLFEAVIEHIDIKHAVYERLDQFAPNAKFLASVTSAISADTLAAGTMLKERLLVAHLWNPPHMVTGVELVRSQYTSDSTVETALEFLTYLGRNVVVLKKNIEGFIGNRILHAMYREALYLIEQGIADAEDIDKLIHYSFGQRFSSVGVLEYFDSCGLDLHADVESYLFPTLSNAQSPQKIITDNIEKGNLGMKTGHGIFDWTKKDIDDFIYRKEKPFYQYVNWHFPK